MIHHDAKGSIHGCVFSLGCFVMSLAARFTIRGNVCGAEWCSMTDRPLSPARRAALLRLADGAVRITHPDFGDGPEVRAMIDEGLIVVVRPLPETVAYRMQLTPAGLSAARAIREGKDG